MLTRKLDGFMYDTFPVQCFYLTFSDFPPAISDKLDWFALCNTYSSTKYLDTNTQILIFASYTSIYPTTACKADQQHWATCVSCTCFLKMLGLSQSWKHSKTPGRLQVRQLKRQENQFNLLLYHCCPNELPPSPLLPFSTECQLWVFCKASVLRFPDHTLYINVGQLTIDQVHPCPDDAELFECHTITLTIILLDISWTTTT